MIPLSGVEAFVAVVEAGSFVGAGQALDLTTSAVSRAVARLEQSLGVRLLHRTTRRVQPTEEGLAYFARSVRLLRDFAEANEAAAHGRDTPLGRLRAEVPVSLGRLLIVPALPGFLRRFPGVELQLGMNDRVADLLEEGIDVALRIGELSDSSLVAHRIGATRWVTAAAPRYLEAHGIPEDPQDLHGLDCVRFFFPTTGRPLSWQFERDGQRLSVDMPSRLTLGNAEATVEAAEIGLGVTQTLDYMLEPAIRAGRLVRLLQACECPGPPISAIHPSNRYLSSRVRCFIDFARATLEAPGSGSAIARGAEPG